MAIDEVQQNLMSNDITLFVDLICKSHEKGLEI